MSTSPAELFDNPPRDFSPTPLWWWSGAKVTRERLRWQLERFLAGGVYNLVIINLAPAGPIVGARADDPAWFSEEWWDRFIDTCRIAEELGMRIWFYDQIGFSGANVQGSITHDHPDAAGLALRLRDPAVHGGRVEVVGSEVVVAGYVPDGGVPKGYRRIDVEPDGAVGAPDGTVLSLVTAVPTAFDYLAPAAVGLLIDLIHGEFERRVPQFLGNVIAGSFQDELPATNSWTPRFADEFRTRLGYDVLDHLPALWRGSDDASAKVRGDYYAVRTELTEEALFRPLGEWHDRRGMLIGADQFNPARAGLPNQSTQLYSDYFRTHRWYNAAGSDHEGDAKVHSSMAHLYGHQRVWMESFHSSGWGGTLEDTYDWLLPMLRSGANLYNPHASYFGTQGGWFEWAPPSTDWRQPYWQHYPDFARAVARISSVMSWGSFSGQVAVLHPTAVAQALMTLDAPLHHFGDCRLGPGFEEADRAQDDYLTLCGSNNWFESRPALLDQAGISFDVIDDASVQRSSVTDGALQVRDLHYTSVLLPSASVLEEATALRLIELLEAGGQVVVVGRPPRMAAGASGDDAVVRRLAEHPSVTYAGDPRSAVGVVRTAEYAVSDVPLLVRRSGPEAVALVTGAYPNASRYPLRTGGRRWTDYDFDAARYAETKTVTVAASVSSAEVWDPATGRRSPAAVRVEDGASRIEVPLAGAPAMLVRWTEGDPGAPSEPVGSPEVTLVDVSDGWTGELVPTMDNSYGDLALPAGSSVEALQLWTLDWSEPDLADAADRVEVKVTHGQQVAVHGPVSVAAVPSVLTPEDVAAVLAGATPLDGKGWTRHAYSNSRGRVKDAGLLGNKGLVPEEFLQVAAPGDGEVTVVRAVVATERPGDADLVIGAGAARRMWWNGQEVPTGAAYLSVAPVTANATNVLELHLGRSENAPGFHVHDSTLGCFFALAAPGAFGSRPELMCVGHGLVPDGRVHYSHQLDVGSPVESAVLVVGAGTGLSILIDGQDVARQERVEYYETSGAAEPMFFRHDVTAWLGVGTHEVALVADSTQSVDVVYVDLVVQHADGATTLASGPGWSTLTGGRTGGSRVHRGHWSELAPAHAAARSHPLPEVEWLNGRPVVGQPVDRVRTAVSLQGSRQCFQVEVPAGTTRIELPTRLRATAELDGDAVEEHDGVLALAATLRQPAVLTVTTEPTAFDRGGAAWSGPLTVHTRPAPLRLGSWRHLGLRSWSGGVRYSQDVELPSGTGPVTLDLGRVRGSVVVFVDGERAGSAFCAPYRFELPRRQERVRLEITVYNTLGPFFDESTPTTWVWPSQLESGLYGPVRLRVGTPV